MIAFAAVIATSLKTFLRDRGAVFWGVAFPLVLMGLIGVAFGRGDARRLTVSVVREGESPLAEPLIAGLRRIPVISVVEEEHPRALEQLRRGWRALVIIIPSRGTTLQALYDIGRAQNGSTALALLERFVAEANLRLSGAATLVRVRPVAMAGMGMTFFDFLLPGVLALTIAQTGLLTVAYMVAAMRERLVLKRVMATPVSPLAFLGGLVGRFSLVGLVQSAIIFVVATYGFGAHTRGSLVSLGLLALVGSIAFFGIGFAISTVSATPESANLLGSVVNFPMMLLAGTFWPREFMPEAVRPLIGYLPLSPLVDAMRGVGAYGEPLNGHAWAIVYLLGWAAAAFALAMRLFRWE